MTTTDTKSSTSSTPQKKAIDDRFIRVDEVLQKTSLSKSALYRYIADQTFPRPTKIGKKSIVWRLSVIDSWMAQIEQQEG